MSLRDYLAANPCCERPNLRVLEENQQYRTLVCLNCKSDRIVTRNKLKSYAREENERDRFQAISEAERRTVKIFGSHYAGARHA
jgi:hypothetical protein